MTFCEQVRKQMDLYWEGSFNHPFVLGIVDGTLPLEKFNSFAKEFPFLKEREGL